MALSLHHLYTARHTSKERGLEELRRMREEAGFTQVGLARTSGVDRGTIIKIERGQRSPTVETLAKLARAMGAEISDFFPKAQASLWPDETPEERRVSWDEVLRRSFEDARRAMDQGASLDELFPEQREWLQEKLAAMDEWHYGMGIQDMGAQERSVAAEREPQTARVRKAKKAKKIETIGPIHVQTRGTGLRNKKRERQ